MTVRLIEGFDHFQDPTAKNWVTVYNVGPGTTTAWGFDTPRVGALGHSWKMHLHASLGIGAGQGTLELKKVFPTSTDAIFGFGWKTDSATNGDNARVYLTTNTGSGLVYLRINGTRNIEIVTAGGTVIATSTSIMQSGIWHYIELRVKINGASGLVEMYVDGGPDVPATTVNLGTTPVGGIDFWVHVNGGYDEPCEYWVDDVYLLDRNSGVAPHNDYLGDCRIETLIPVAPGASSGWTPLAGANWAAVDEMSGTFPDGDATYVTAQNTGDLDLYVCSDMSTINALVYAVQANLTARKDTAGFKQIKPVTRQGGSNYGGAPMTLSTSYITKQEIFEKDPTGSLWTPATVNGDQYGMEVIV